MKRKHRHLFLGCIVVFGTFLLSLLLNKPVITITLNGESRMHAEAGMYYEDPGATARKHGSIYAFLGETIPVQVTSGVNTAETGTYTVEYSAEWEDLVASEIRTVVVEDTTPPVLTLTENPDAYTLPDHPYTEEGYRAVDFYDGDVTDAVVFEEKDGKVYYSVTDAAGNRAEAERTIIYDDRKGPEFTFENGAETIWYVGAGDFEDSYTAVDDLDGDVTEHVIIDGTVDTGTVGDYTLVYSVTDSYGNTTTAERVVHVQNAPAVPPGTEDSKTIYLTFDDGPGPYTDQLLDILAKYNVKATFFTTGVYGNYSYCIGKEAAAGHTVAVHTSGHDYARIYANTDAYWADYNRQKKLIEDQTGSCSTLFRFPGGSSNTVSRSYCPGVMTALVNQAAGKGLEYFDWNVSSGDAGATTSTQTVYSNVTGQIEKNSAAGYPSVVLQHDVKDYSVAAVEDIIKWGLKNGYHFERLVPGSFHAHHGLAN